MTVLLLALTGVLTLVVIAVSVLALRLAQRVQRLESQVPEPTDAAPTPHATLERHQPQEYLITRVGEPSLDDPAAAAAPIATTVPASLFADLVARETVVRVASLAHGLRRALAPETRNRIRFEMRQEVKRSRKQRRADLRTARREWEARQRQGLDESRDGPIDGRASAA